MSFPVALRKNDRLLEIGRGVLAQEVRSFAANRRGFGGFGGWSHSDDLPQPIRGRRQSLQVDRRSHPRHGECVAAWAGELPKTCTGYGGGGESGSAQGGGRARGQCLDV